MGKPFQDELAKVGDTLNWANEQNIERLQKELIHDNKVPLIVVGSGGSLSVCYYVVHLCQSLGLHAKAYTPLELIYARPVLNSAKILFISASGKNSDILFAFESAIQEEPVKILNLCMRLNSPLSDKAKRYSISSIFEYDLPSGKDGFLATNSLVAFFSILSKVFSNSRFKNYSNLLDKEFQQNLSAFCSRVKPNFTFTILHAGWATPVAIDIESKLAEAALGDVLLSDYRNFGHGRHHWFDKRGTNSAIIALVTPAEKQLVEKTISLLPSNIPVLKIMSNLESSHSSIELLLKSFQFINALGAIQGIDPGRPGVPDFGSKLYNLNYKRFFKHNVSHVDRYILRKLGRSSGILGDSEKKYWVDAYYRFLSKLQNTSYGSLVFDYDGTLCSSEGRFSGVDNIIADYLVEFVKGGLIIGIATGRGQSVRIDLQRVIPREYWDSVMIGYYNCSEIGLLSENDCPNKNGKPSKILKKLSKDMETWEFFHKVKHELKKHQVTIEISDSLDWHIVKNFCTQYIATQGLNGIEVLESSHSIDIVELAYASKLNILTSCKRLSAERGLSADCLCIGDKGKYPGNDYKLLSTDYSLSVDEVSCSPLSCWNLSPIGVRNIEASKYYLSCLYFSKNGLNLKLK